ncbi:unnamed protein product [Ilex paraguariensis]|uniref:SLC26A/SulP transporter domain-containing protein n=1 Tax=Ilex paraguariensis TaxID=185542 RepID=A0ABC8RI34_9AQUA
MRKTKLFWVSAGAPLASVIISTMLVFAFKAQHHGISVIEKLQEGLNPPSWNMLHFHGSHLGLVMKTRLVTGIISLTMSFCSSFPPRYPDEVELIDSDGDTPLPHATVPIHTKRCAGCNHSHAVVGLIDLPAAYHIWKVDKFDFVVMLCAFLGVIFISIEYGLAIAVSYPCSGRDIYIQISPTNHKAKNGDVGKHTWNGYISQSSPLQRSCESPRISRWIEDYVTEEEEETKKHSGLHFVILDLSGKSYETWCNIRFVRVEGAVNAIDTSRVSFLKDLRMAMEKKGLEPRNIDFLFISLLVLVNPLGEVMDKLQRAYESREFMRLDALFLTVREVVTTLTSTIKGQSSNNV